MKLQVNLKSILSRMHDEGIKHLTGDCTTDTTWGAIARMKEIFEDHEGQILNMKPLGIISEEKVRKILQQKGVLYPRSINLKLLHEKNVVGNLSLGVFEFLNDDFCSGYFSYTTKENQGIKPCKLHIEHLFGCEKISGIQKVLPVLDLNIESPQMDRRKNGTFDMTILSFGGFPNALRSNKEKAGIFALD